MEVEDRLAPALAYVHNHAIVVEAGLARGFRDEVQHPLGLVGWELPDFAKGRDVTLR